MGLRRRMHIGRITVACSVLTLLGATGCQLSAPVATRQILRQQALLDFTGLFPGQSIEHLRVSWAVPRDWEELPPKRGPIFIHQQYRSPTGVTGVGVVYVRMPIPVPASAIAWLAQREYLKRNSDNREGRVLGNWTDEAGREWFEVENNRYRGTGYVMSRGSEAWIVYSGHRLTAPPNAEEISISRRSAQTIIPVVRGR